MKKQILAIILGATLTGCAVSPTGQVYATPVNIGIGVSRAPAVVVHPTPGYYHHPPGYRYGGYYYRQPRW